MYFLAPVFQRERNRREGGIEREKEEKREGEEKLSFLFSLGRSNV